MRTFDLGFKRKVVREYLAGKGGYKLLATKFGVADAVIRRWVSAYRHHGDAGLVRKRGAYTLEFKLEVLGRAAIENLSCRELAAIYNISNPHSIATWQQQHARSELLYSRKELPGSWQDDVVPAKRKNPMGQNPQDRQDLQRENEKLRAEVAYLKKVNALVLAKKSAPPKERK